MNGSQVLKKAYVPFQNCLTFSDFQTKVSNLGNSKWNFIRASLLYQQSLKCKNCEPNVAMVLLCSCADAMKVAGPNAGSRRNFKQLYLRHCPKDKRDSPMKYYPNNKPPAQPVPFNKALDFIYSKFRCLYVHEGIGRLELPPRDFEWFKDALLDKYNNEIYAVDIIKILEWFTDITLESLYDIL